jgi:hypothetical protein
MKEPIPPLSIEGPGSLTNFMWLEHKKLGLAVKDRQKLENLGIKIIKDLPELCEDAQIAFQTVQNTKGLTNCMYAADALDKQAVKKMVEVLPSLSPKAQFAFNAIRNMQGVSNYSYMTSTPGGRNMEFYTTGIYYAAERIIKETIPKLCEEAQIAFSAASGYRRIDFSQPLKNLAEQLLAAANAKNSGQSIKEVFV